MWPKKGPKKIKVEKIMKRSADLALFHTFVKAEADARFARQNSYNRIGECPSSA